MFSLERFRRFRRGYKKGYSKLPKPFSKLSKKSRLATRKAVFFIAKIVVKNNNHIFVV